METQATYEAVRQLVDSQEGISSLLLRDDFAVCGPREEVDKALARLVAEERMVALRDDAFAFTELSTFSGKRILRCTLQSLAEEYAVRRGASICMTSAQREYYEGSTQVPNGRWIGVDRKIGGELRFLKQAVQFELV